MEITYPISSSRFLLAMQVYARKMSTYETYEEVKKREFERISLFRPLPTVSKESIKTREVSSPTRYELVVDDTETELVDFDSLFANLEDINLGDLPNKESSTGVSVAKSDDVDPFASVDLESLGYVDDMGEDELEGKEFETSEDIKFEELLLDPLNSPVSNLTLNTTESTLGEENLNLSHSEKFGDTLNTEPTRVEFKEEIFRSTYIGKREPWSYVAKDKVKVVKEVIKPKQVVEPKPFVKTGNSSNSSQGSVRREVKPSSLSSVPPQKSVSSPNAATDKGVRLLNEDFVSYCRRNLRVQEQLALTYFSPNEIESAVRQGKILRKSGLLIFAHS